MRVTNIHFASSTTHAKCNQALSEYKHSLTFRVRWESALNAFAVYKAISLHTCMMSMLSQQRNPCTDCKSAQ